MSVKLTDAQRWALQAIADRVDQIADALRARIRQMAEHG